MCFFNYNKKYKHITLAERTIRQEIIMKLPDKETKTTAKLQIRQKEYIEVNFKSITFDN